MNIGHRVDFWAEKMRLVITQNIVLGTNSTVVFSNVIESTCRSDGQLRKNFRVHSFCFLINETSRVELKNVPKGTTTTLEKTNLPVFWYTTSGQPEDPNKTAAMKLLLSHIEPYLDVPGNSSTEYVIKRIRGCLTRIQEY
jgi:hypothetical protein